MKMEQKDQPYIASVKTYDNHCVQIMKDVTKKLKDNPNLSIDGLIGYLLEDDGFREDEKEIKSQLDELISIGRRGYENVDIRFENNKGEHRIIRTYPNKNMVLARGGSNINIRKAEIKKVKDYFEDKSLDGMNYKGVDIELEIRHMD